MIKRLILYAFLLFLPTIIWASSIVSIPIAWDHEAPETVDWYNIYVSETQGVYPDIPYARITRLPDNSHPLYLRFNVDTKTIYLRVKAENENGESDWSNEVKVEMSFIVTYLE